MLKCQKFSQPAGGNPPPGTLPPCLNPLGVNTYAFTGFSINGKVKILAKLRLHLSVTYIITYHLSHLFKTHKNSLNMFATIHTYWHLSSLDILDIFIQEHWISLKLSQCFDYIISTNQQYWKSIVVDLHPTHFTSCHFEGSEVKHPAELSGKTLNFCDIKQWQYFCLAWNISILELMKQNKCLLLWDECKQEMFSVDMIVDLCHVKGIVNMYALSWTDVVSDCIALVLQLKRLCQLSWTFCLVYLLLLKSNG